MIKNEACLLNSQNLHWDSDEIKNKLLILKTQAALYKKRLS